MPAEGHTYLGQTYPYHKNISTPDDLGLTPEGSVDALIKNVAGLINYWQVLITGDGHANAKVFREHRDEPMGDKYFLKTMGTCHPVKVEKGKPETKNDINESCEFTGEEGDTCDYVYLKKDVDNKDDYYLDNGNPCDDPDNCNKAVVKRYVYVDNIPTTFFLSKEFYYIVIL